MKSDSDKDKNTISSIKEGFSEEFVEFTCLIPGAQPSQPKNLADLDLDLLNRLPSEPKDRELTMMREAIRIVLQPEVDLNKYENGANLIDIYKIFACYLLSVYPYCSDKFFEEYCLLITMVCKVLNHKGCALIPESESAVYARDIEDLGKQFCDSKNVRFVIDVFNSFVTAYFPIVFRKYLSIEPQFVFLGFDEEQAKNLILMVKMLAIWLRKNGFTEYSLEINVEL